MKTLMNRSLPPHLYHLAEAENWPFIQRHGLLSASALIEACGAGARGVGRAQRTAGVTLPSGAMLRDQVPMPPTALERCLVKMTPTEWYALVNQHTFLWPDVERLQRFRNAPVQFGRPQVLLVIDTAKLLAAHAERVFLTPINVGSARRRPARRGEVSFVPYASWLANGWASESVGLDTTARSRRHPPAEVAVRGGVGPIEKLLVQAIPVAVGEPLSLPAR